MSQLSTWFSSQDAAELGHIKRGVKCVLGPAGQGRVKAGVVDSGARLWDPPGLYVPTFSQEVGPEAKVATMLCSKKTQYEHSASDQLTSRRPHTHVTPASLGAGTDPSFQTMTERCRGFCYVLVTTSIISFPPRPSSEQWVLLLSPFMDGETEAQRG